MSREGEVPSVYTSDHLPAGDEESIRISNAIDEDLKVSFRVVLVHWYVDQILLQHERELRRRRRPREVKGGSSRVHAYLDCTGPARVGTLYQGITD